jgi:hypothetical protein
LNNILLFNEKFELEEDMNIDVNSKAPANGY